MGKLESDDDDDDVVVAGAGATPVLVALPFPVSVRACTLAASSKAHNFRFPASAYAPSFRSALPALKRAN